MKKLFFSDDEIRRLLHRVGLQATSQRKALCRYILGEADHVSAEEVKEWADQHLQKVSLATVYNTLKALVNVGLLKELRFPHLDKVLYDRNTSDHHHFLDLDTGKVVDIEMDQVNIVSSLDPQYQVEKVELLFRGQVSQQS